MTQSVHLAEICRKVVASWARENLPGRGGTNRVGTRQWRVLCFADLRAPHPTMAVELARVAYPLDWVHAGMAVVQSLVASHYLSLPSDHDGPVFDAQTLLWLTPRGEEARMNARARAGICDG